MDKAYYSVYVGHKVFCTYKDKEEDPEKTFIGIATYAIGDSIRIVSLNKKTIKDLTRQKITFITIKNGGRKDGE